MSVTVCFRQSNGSGMEAQGQAATSIQRRQHSTLPAFNAASLRRRQPSTYLPSSLISASLHRRQPSSPLPRHLPSRPPAFLATCLARSDPEFLVAFVFLAATSLPHLRQPSSPRCLLGRQPSSPPAFHAVSLSSHPAFLIGFLATSLPRRQSAAFHATQPSSPLAFPAPAASLLR